MNKVVLVGRLTKDPTLIFAQGTGNAVCKFTVAVNRRFKKEGQPETDFLPVTVFGKTGEATANYMVKGSQVGISGSVQTSTYMKDNVKMYKTEVIADEVDFLDSKGKGESSGQNNSNNANNSFDSNSDITPIDDSDIPF
ncbi:single-stranded DNA-binding protein [Clostridium tagluense]|uniref:single-stranded DNA-binding protein n=1 Tax=Clostridium tagluense TaxID=360422 RepID=UPI001CF4AABA|nr:single-stranded DNA-binding protein [Clostridium tagluense]MCB2310676.1 single-stranded DNA-binding protein [Clostridium tagluense]MCB2315594.1 single-stranded DNA-binding protein [Clostridium tagluense]MCB2320448.1 single-stranded DNA-binding protein [Clostridium tagluense]MCB2325269.1 single-stranded DNA-binding protein [Clostridium tagluense]MCB2330121.1 single-stranded DNA-binding protein [Clostridium tagluense]